LAETGGSVALPRSGGRMAAGNGADAVLSAIQACGAAGGRLPGVARGAFRCAGGAAHVVATPRKTTP
jgi:hypothetical protein